MPRLSSASRPTPRSRDPVGPADARHAGRRGAPPGQAIRPEATRLLFTAYADIRAVIDAINQGHVFRYITKPWEPEELEAVVRQAVEQHDLIVEQESPHGRAAGGERRLVEANRLKTAFIEVASHELNTPVAVVLGLTELWKMSLGRDCLGPERLGRADSDGRASGWPGRSSGCSSWSETNEFGQTL